MGAGLDSKLGAGEEHSTDTGGAVVPLSTLDVIILLLVCVHSKMYY